MFLYISILSALSIFLTQDMYETVLAYYADRKSVV